METEGKAAPPGQARAAPPPHGTRHSASEDRMPAPVRSVLLISMAVSVAALALLGLIHHWQKAQSRAAEAEGPRVPLTGGNG